MDKLDSLTLDMWWSKLFINLMIALNLLLTDTQWFDSVNSNSGMIAQDSSNIHEDVALNWVWIYEWKRPPKQKIRRNLSLLGEYVD